MRVAGVLSNEVVHNDSADRVSKTVCETEVEATHVVGVDEGGRLVRAGLQHEIELVSPSFPLGRESESEHLVGQNSGRVGTGS